MYNNTIYSTLRTRHSLTPGAQPKTLALGELAVNTVDKTLFVGGKDITGSPIVHSLLQPVTTTQNGLMLSSDKVKLDSLGPIAEQAKKLSQGRTITYEGFYTSKITFDGSTDITAALSSERPLIDADFNIDDFTHAVGIYPFINASLLNTLPKISNYAAIRDQSGYLTINKVNGVVYQEIVFNNVQQSRLTRNTVKDEDKWHRWNYAAIDLVQDSEITTNRSVDIPRSIVDGMTCTKFGDGLMIVYGVKNVPMPKGGILAKTTYTLFQEHTFKEGTVPEWTIEPDVGVISNAIVLDSYTEDGKTINITVALLEAAIGGAPTIPIIIKAVGVWR